MVSQSLPEGLIKNFCDLIKLAINESSLLINSLFFIDKGIQARDRLCNS